MTTTGFSLRSWASARIPSVPDYDRDDSTPTSVVRELHDRGLFALRADGGTGLELLEASRALSYAWISWAGMVNPTWLVSDLLERHGTPAQQARHLHRIRDERLTCAFSISEPGAGSNLHDITTRAETVDGAWRLDGHKRWIAGGMSAGLWAMLARTPRGLSCLLIERERPSSDTGLALHLIGKPGYRGVESAEAIMTRWIPDHVEILGGQEGRGAGHMLDALNLGRVNVSGRGLGLTDRALDLIATEHETRHIGGVAIGERFSHLRLRLGELRARRLAAEALARQAARDLDENRIAARDTCAAAKVICGELAVDAVDALQRAQASRSYTHDAEAARLARDVRQLLIGEGAHDTLLATLGR